MNNKLWILLLCSFGISAQYIEVTYSFEKDATANQSFHDKLHGVLYAGDTVTVYRDEIRPEGNAWKLKEANQKIAIPMGKRFMKLLESTFLRYHSTNTFWSTEHLELRKKVVKDTISTQDWTLTKQTREIGGYSCQMAHTHFRGRDYTAWFTMQVPISSGPWKLGGLPGLILEAYDKERVSTFMFKSIRKIEAYEVPVLDTSHYMSWAEYKASFREKVKNPSKRMLMFASALGNSVVKSQNVPENFEQKSTTMTYKLREKSVLENATLKLDSLFKSNGI